VTRSSAVGDVVVAGSLAQKPGAGGHTWVFLQYLLGFRRLGWRTTFVDRIVANSADPEARYARAVLERFEIPYALVRSDGTTVGIPRSALVRRLRSAIFLMNVMGFLDDDDLLAAAPRRVFLDIDPGFGQMWRELGLADVFEGHDDFVTIAENIGRRGCTVPTCGLTWLTTPQPVVLEQWPCVAGGRAFTSVVRWRGSYAPIDYRGRTYGLRVHEFRRFMELPRRTKRRFELALDIDAADAPDREALATHGWRLADPRRVAGDPWRYRSYIQASGGEFMVAKQLYAETRSGWLSDRSLCYLASGKPVVATDTGFGASYGGAEGLLAYSSLDEAATAVEAVCSDYGRHARAARALAEDRFDSDKVLGRLLASLGG
jgi:hypothetical protein